MAVDLTGQPPLSLISKKTTIGAVQFTLNISATAVSRSYLKRSWTRRADKTTIVPYIPRTEANEITDASTTMSPIDH